MDIIKAANVFLLACVIFVGSYSLLGVPLTWALMATVAWVAVALGYKSAKAPPTE